MRFFVFCWLAVLTLLVSYSSFATLDDTYSDNKPEDKFSFSGFGQLVIGKLNTDKANYNDYDDSFSFKSESLLGLQFDYKFTEQLSLSSQVIAYSNSKRNSGISWLTLNYQPNKNVLVKIGKLKVPFFNYSDISNVGFSYPWITLPEQVYNDYMFDEVDGVFFRYDVPVSIFSFNLEGYWGSKKDTYYIGHDLIDIDVDDLKGLIANIGANNLSFRASIHQAHNNSGDRRILEFSKQLRQLGFTESADSLSLKGDVNFYQVSINYDNLDYFIRSEWSKVSPKEISIPTIESSYFTIGYNQYPFTVSLTRGASNTSYSGRAFDIPLGVSPELDALNNLYNFTYNSLPRDTLDSTSLGIRWDWQTNIAIKTDVTWLKGQPNNRSFYNIIDESFDRKSTLFQVAITWVF
ncbi:hypothetical protein [Psychrosphaera aestuarii]|uniref:hypothetical protein n=1 Tax=Psychrosphaera aestuarii TaxID=1266052 RepID=UPI001B342B7C|nr:hypothetical protein [Psychrosphaera aestuarii]